MDPTNSEKALKYNFWIQWIKWKWFKYLFLYQNLAKFVFSAFEDGHSLFIPTVSSSLHLLHKFFFFFIFILSVKHTYSLKKSYNLVVSFPYVHYAKKVL